MNPRHDVSYRLFSKHGDLVNGKAAQASCNEPRLLRGKALRHFRDAQIPPRSIRSAYPPAWRLMPVSSLCNAAASFDSVVVFEHVFDEVRSVDYTRSIRAGRLHRRTDWFSICPAWTREACLRHHRSRAKPRTGLPAEPDDRVCVPAAHMTPVQLRSSALALMASSRASRGA
jgi:hypothetical protein